MKAMKKTNLIALFCVGSLALSGLALGQQNGPKRHRRPPPEAIDACKGKASGDSCSFESPRGTENGTCWAPRQDRPLACRTPHPPQGR